LLKLSYNWVLIYSITFAEILSHIVLLHIASFSSSLGSLLGMQCKHDMVALCNQLAWTCHLYWKMCSINAVVRGLLTFKEKTKKQ